jgi:hypothetical protein
MSLPGLGCSERECEVVSMDLRRLNRPSLKSRTLLQRETLKSILAATLPKIALNWAPNATHHDFAPRVYRPPCPFKVTRFESSKLDPLVCLFCYAHGRLEEVTGQFDRIMYKYHLEMWSIIQVWRTNRPFRTSA